VQDLKLQVDSFRSKLETTEHLSWLGEWFISSALVRRVVTTEQQLGDRVRFPAGVKKECFSLRHRTLTGSGAHVVSYAVGTGDSFPGSKATGTWSRPLASNYYLGEESVELYLHYPIHFHGVVLN
jgi:hypothetical protein